MGIFDISGGSVSPVEIYKQWSAPGASAISAGKAIYRNPTTGFATLCGSVNAAEGIAITTTGYANQSVTAVQQGRIDLGGSALTPYSFGASVYVHGEAGGTALGSLGTVPTGGGTWLVGKITPVFQSHSGNVGGTLSPDRLLDIDL
jgi:hypothetical protein